jgi:hypothetical protein
MKQTVPDAFTFEEDENIFTVANENADDMNSEQIGKRKTIHSMKAMSIN